MNKLFELARRNNVELCIRYSDYSDTFIVTVIKSFLKKDVTFSRAFYETVMSEPSDVISIMIVDAISELDRLLASDAIKPVLEPDAAIAL